jgi:1,4-alpha-glucan branching enzyme
VTVTSSPTHAPVPGMFTLVLHTHLPWLAHHGRWPVGEEWLYQSWATAYLPLTRVLRTLAGEGRSHLLTLGMTPVVTAQLDDPYCLAGMAQWLSNWQLRALEATTVRDGGGAPDTFNSPEALRAFGFDEHQRAGAAIEEFNSHWQHGGSPVLRELIDAETIELLGGPLAHPFQPLLNPRLREFALREGLSDAQQRFAHTPGGIWAPECAYAPGMETGYAAAGVTHFMVAARRCTAIPRWDVRSANRTSSPSAATCRSATGCGPPSLATPDMARTATSTPTTI